MTVSEALDLEDWVQMKNKEYRSESTLSCVKYYLRIHILPLLLKAAAVLFAIMSIIVSIYVLYDLEKEKQTFLEKQNFNFIVIQFYY